MWQFLLIAAAGTGFLARCLQKRPAVPKEGDSIGNRVVNFSDDLGLELLTQISSGDDTHIVEDRKADPSVYPMNEQASGEVSATVISSHSGSPEIPTSWKGKAKAFHGYRGRGFCWDAQCSEIRDFHHSEDHQSSCSGSWNVGHTQKKVLKNKIVTKKRKASRHVEGKKLNADIVGQYERSQGALWFSYGVGVGVMFMIASGKCEFEKLTLLLHQTIGLVQELRRQRDEREDYLQNSETPKDCHGEIYTYQQEQLGAAANWNLEKEYPNSVGTTFQDNESAGSVITDEPAQLVTGVVELETELQAELEFIQMDFLQESSKHQRKKSGFSELSNSSVDMVEGGLYADGLPGQWSSANKTPSVPLEISHVDDYGVSPYELHSRLRDLLEKQQEERISELEVELKSTESKLHAKERELQHWKERVRCLAELSFGANSGDNSASFEVTNNADGKRHFASKASLKSSVKSINNSEQEGDSMFPFWAFGHCTEGPLESTADSLEQLNYRGKMADFCTGSTDFKYFEDIVQTGWVPDSQDSTEGACMDFVKHIADVGSDGCYQSNSTSKHSIGRGIGDMHENESEASTACSVFGHE